MIKHFSWFHVKMKRARILDLWIYSLLYSTIEVKLFPLPAKVVGHLLRHHRLVSPSPNGIEDITQQARIPV